MDACIVTIVTKSASQVFEAAAAVAVAVSEDKIKLP
jgi:hypothetical protein